MIGSLISAGLQIAQGIAGGIKASKAAKKAKAINSAQQSENRDWFNRRYGEDATQRADAQRVLTHTQEIIRDRNNAAAGTQAVMGGTDASVAATQQQNNQVLAEATSAIAAAGEQRKDAIEQQAREREAQLKGEEKQIENNRAMAVTQATAGAASALGNIGGAIDDYLDERSENNVTA